MNTFVTSLFGDDDNDVDSEEISEQVSRSPFVLTGLPPEVENSIEFRFLNSSVFVILLNFSHKRGTLNTN